jgi:hypothetical protein
MAVTSCRCDGGLGRHRPIGVRLVEGRDWCRIRSFKCHWFCQRCASGLVDGLAVFVRKSDFSAQGGECVAEANALCRLHGLFQDIAYLGLGAAAVLGGTHAQGAVHLIRGRFRTVIDAMMSNYLECWG